MSEFEHSQNSKHTQFLKNLYASGRFPHVLIIEGDNAGLLSSLSLFAAKLLLCGDDALSGSGPACAKIDGGNHPDIMFINPLNKTKSIGVEQIRDLKADIYISPNEADRRVFIFLNAQLLTRQAQNAALKIFEEPPKTAHFILCCPSVGDLLETVRSRSVTLSTLGENGKDVEGALFDEMQSLLKSVLEYKRYEAMVMLNKYEAERENYRAMLENLKGSAIGLLKSKRITALQCNSFVGIIEEAVVLTDQNVSLALISTVLTDKLLAAVSI